MLLYQKAPYILFPFSTANMNLHLGTMIRNMNYRQLKAFNQYMINNVNHKLVPIQKARPGSKAQRQLFLKEYYTIARSVASLP